MKIKTKELKGFLEKVNMKDSVTLDEAIFDFKPDGISIRQMIAANIGMIEAWFSANHFTDYNAVGEVGIPNITRLKGLLKSFGDEVEIVIGENLMTLKSEGKKVEFELLDIDIMKGENSPSKPPAFTIDEKGTFDETFTVSSVKMKEFFGDVTGNVKVDDGIFKIVAATQDSKLVLNNTGRYKFTQEIVAEGATGGSVVNLGRAFIDATEKLSGNLLVGVKSDYPIKIVEETENHSIKVMIAPKIEKEE